MKFCAVDDDNSHNYKNSSQSTPQQLLFCVDISGDMDPQNNDTMDAIAASMLCAYVLVSGFCLANYIRLRKCRRISRDEDSAQTHNDGDGRPAIAIQTSVSVLAWFFGIVHLASVFVTYGFFSRTLGPLLLTKHCSIWTIWTQYVAGFSAWAAVLSAHLIGVAIIIVRCVRVISLRRRRMLYVATKAVVITPMIAVGVVSELVAGVFTVTHGGLECQTSTQLKIAIMSWLMALAIIFAVCARLVKRAVVRADFHALQSDSVAKLVDAEIGIAKYAMPILILCIFLNFTHLVAYAAGRFTFLVLILLMHAKSSWALFGSYFAEHFDAGNNVCGWLSRCCCFVYHGTPEYHHMDDDGENFEPIEMSVVQRRDVVDEANCDEMPATQEFTLPSPSLLKKNAEYGRIRRAGPEFDAFLDYVSSLSMQGDSVTIEYSHSNITSFRDSDDDDDDDYYEEIVSITNMFDLCSWCSGYKSLVELTKWNGAMSPRAENHPQTHCGLLERTKSVLDANFLEMMREISGVRCVQKLDEALCGNGAGEDLEGAIESVMVFMRVVMIDNFFDAWYAERCSTQENAKTKQEHDAIADLIDDGFMSDIVVPVSE